MKKFRLTLLFILLLALQISPPQARAALIRILHVNDFHGFAEPYEPLGAREKLGGAAYLAARVEALRKEKPSLLLAAGDMISGNNWANLFKGRPVIELMNLMRFDALVVGNHEFDYGPAVLRQSIAAAKFPVLGANVAGLDALKPYVVRQVDGVRVGIIGVVTEDTPVTTHPTNVAGLKFLPVVPTVEKYLRELKNQADIFVVLSHIGFRADMDLAAKVPGIDIIVGGHSHTKIPTPKKVGNTIIVQAWEHGKALGVLDLTVEGGKIVKFSGHLEEIKPAGAAPDPAAARLVKYYQEEVDARLGQTIGATLVDLDGENVRTRETNFGDFVADIMRETTGADAALINGGAIRVGIRKGPLTKSQIYSALPFDNYLVAIRLTGRQIRAALEHGVSRVQERKGRFPQVSGLAFTYSPAAPPGRRVKAITIAGQPLDPDRQYTVATIDFLAAGGDGYQGFGEAVRASADYSNIGGALRGKNLVYTDPSRLLRDIVADYIQRRKRISPALEGRIKTVN